MFVHELETELKLIEDGSQEFEKIMSTSGSQQIENPGIEAVDENLTWEEAKGLEQASIEKIGLKKDNEMSKNIIYSMSPNNPNYDEFVKKGKEILEKQ